MSSINLTSIFLLISLFVVLFMIFFLIKMKKHTQIRSVYLIVFFLLLFWLIGLLLQIFLSKPLNIKPIVFEYFIYICACFLPVVLLFVGIIFANTKIKFKKIYFLLFVIPIISLIILWTNDYHHLFYKYYSTNTQSAIVGPYFIIHTLYSYACILVGMAYLIFYSIKNAGLFSKQSLLICSGTLISLGINILATFGVFDLSIYVTPISFVIAILFIALAIFKFNFLSIAPIALQRIVDRMSDAYLVLNEENSITDFNNTFLNVFEVKSSQIRNISIFDLISKSKDFKIDVELLKNAIEKVKTAATTVEINEHFDSIDKYFHIEINNITSKGNFLGTLILFKDITQHTVDMQTIKDNQDLLIEKERLASLGQMIGGIAHNLKTPIMSIAGAAEGISDLVKEYNNSIEDPNVNFEDHHAIAADMNEWIVKIRTHLEYMSDIITAVKGQAVAFSDNTSNGFTVDDLLKHIDILMKHELKNALIDLNTSVDIDLNKEVRGNINSLVQVVNNIISNGIQAYKGVPNKNIDFSVYEENKKLVIKVRDYAGGLPDNVKDKLFKEMITTKGKNGTGLGLFMSYSNIRAHFNGLLRYETKTGDRHNFLHRNTFIKNQYI